MVLSTASVTSTSTKEPRKLAQAKMQEVHLHQYVTSASRVVAPLWPIATFTSRSPWMGLEDMTFDQTARWMKAGRGVDLYPDAAILRDAHTNGKIDRDHVEEGLQRWLASLEPELGLLPEEEVKVYCEAVLSLTEPPTAAAASPAVQQAVELLGNLSLPFLTAGPAQTVSGYAERKGLGSHGRMLDAHMIKWCKLYLDEAQAGWSMPYRDQGFYGAWRRLAEADPALPRASRKLLKDWPQEAAQALLHALTALQVPESRLQAYLEAHLLALPGWAGMMQWRSQQKLAERSLLLEYLAVRLSMEAVLLKPLNLDPGLVQAATRQERGVDLRPLVAAWSHYGQLPAERWGRMSEQEQAQRLTLAYGFDSLQARRIWLEAWEQTYAASLQQKLASRPAGSAKRTQAVAQLAFCIDVRSEAFRRTLEQAGPYETYGIAGFFGLPVATSELGSHKEHPSLPVIAKPKHLVREAAPARENERFHRRLHVLEGVMGAWKSMKQNVGAGLVLPEASGPWLSLNLLARSFLPRRAGRTLRSLHRAWLRKPATSLTVDRTAASVSAVPLGFTDEEKATYVAQTLRMIGLTAFAPLVVFCGHGSRSANNPYASKLDCGACGGVSGRLNARILAELCNQTSVRKALAEQGLAIPDETVFAAAEHVTTTDELEWVYRPVLAGSALAAYERLQAALPDVSRAVGAERLPKLPRLTHDLHDPEQEAHRFAEDWSEVRPEWGLAGNAAFLIGRRELTEGVNLEGRAFLHSYDWRTDEKEEVLAGIIAGPTTVGQWINLQYYASTVAPHYYGSGSKATQTVTAGLGVMQGNASDLMTGLPWQSVMSSDQHAYHEPLRLLVVVQAPRQAIERLLAQDAAFRRKVDHGWLRLASIEPNGEWIDWPAQEG